MIGFTHNVISKSTVDRSIYWEESVVLFLKVDVLLEHIRLLLIGFADDMERSTVQESLPQQKLPSKQLGTRKPMLIDGRHVKNYKPF